MKAPNRISLELASQVTLRMKMAKCFPSRASFLLVFLLKRKISWKFFWNGSGKQWNISIWNAEVTPFEHALGLILELKILRLVTLPYVETSECKTPKA